MIITTMLGAYLPSDIKVNAEETKSEAEEVTIVKEEEALRGEYEKHFINSDGTYTAVSYEKPVHTLVDGEWEEIDNTLTEEGDVLVNSDGILDVSFANTTEDKADVDEVQASSDLTQISQDEEDELVSIEKDGYKISWTMVAEDEDYEAPAATSYVPKSMFKVKKEGKQTKKQKITYEMKGKKKAKIKEDKLTGMSKEEKKTVAKKVKSEVAYEDLFCDNIDVKYTVISDTVKEDIVLNEKTDIDTFVMEMNLEGLTPIIQEDNSILFKNDADEPVFIMPAPFMMDDELAYSEDIEMSIEKKDDKYILSLTPDKEWLNAEDRVYPVTIDPTVSPVNTASNVRDTYVYTGNSAQHNNEIYMYVGLKGGKVYRPYIKFTTMPTIAGSINSAKMTVTAVSGTTTYGTMKIYQVNSNWDSSTITWANQPTSISYKNLGVRSGYNISFTVTSTVKEWYNGNVYGRNKNYGFTIRYSNEAYNDYNMFYSSEASANRPVLTIVYEPSDNPAYASAVELNSTTSANISYGGQVGWYRLTAYEGGYYTIYSKGSTNTYGKLYESYAGAMTLKSSNDNSGSGDNFKIQYYLEEGKVYYIRVSGNSSNDTGSYNLCVSAGFNNLFEKGYIKPGEEEIEDGKFHMCMVPLSTILKRSGITQLYDANSNALSVDYHYCDWYVYSVGSYDNQTYGLILMQPESEEKRSKVIVSFIEFDMSILINCMKNPTADYKKKLGVEIERVTKSEGQKHSNQLQDYFSDAASSAPYLIAERYVEKVASMAKRNVGTYYLDAPALCKSLMDKAPLLNTGDELNRIPIAMGEIEMMAGYTIYTADHKILIKDINSLSVYEQYIILMTHTGNVNYNSFAAEVEWHADATENEYFADIVYWYEKAVRADMQISDQLSHGGLFDDYYDLNSNLVNMQEKYHGVI